MQLVKALRLGNTPRLALTGAGGKTTALFQLARQLLARAEIRSVLVTVSTHLAHDQLLLANHHIIIQTDTDLSALEVGMPEGVVLVTGPPAEPERIAGLSPVSLERLHALAQAYESPLLVEADGSRRQPLKAPAAHEPVIPAWVDEVVVVAGLTSLGKPLTAEWVHRPERFAELAGIHSNETITPEALTRVLIHSKGGLKGIPTQARRSVLLNQADTAEQQAAGQRIALSILDDYHAALVASLAPFGGHTEKNGVTAVHEPVAGIVLAAGSSSRMGKPKQTLIWRGEALVTYAARVALMSGLSPVIVVTGCAAQDVGAAVDDLPVICTHNPNWELGQSTSVVAGIKALPEACGAAIFLLADQPTIPVSLVRSLVETHARTLDPIIAPLIDGQRANPVLFDRGMFHELLKLSGDVGGRALFSRQRVNWLPWHDDAPLFDIDSPDDYARLLDIQ